jgi:hypothetical protein
MNTVAEAHKRLDRIEPKIEQIDRDVDDTEDRDNAFNSKESLSSASSGSRRCLIGFSRGYHLYAGGNLAKARMRCARLCWSLSDTCF